MDKDIERYNKVVSKIEFAANEIIEIFESERDEYDEYDRFRDICYRLSILLLED